MIKKKLKFYAADDKMINDIEALEGGTCRYVGRRWDPVAKNFPPLDQPSEVSALPEYVMAVKYGDLVPADQSTADYCGVKFIPNNPAEAVALQGKKASFQSK